MGCLLTTVLAGCSGAMRRANARLRTENAQQQDQIAALHLANAELQAQLALAQSEPASGNVNEHIPQLASVAISPLSGLDPSSDDGPVLQVHVQSMDGRGRPIQLAGPLMAQVLLPQQSGPPAVLATTSLDAHQVRDAWRGGPLGTTWLVELPLSERHLREPLLIHIEHTDLRTGRVHRASTTSRGQR